MHALVINTSTFNVWCYLCDDDIAENSSKKLLECVQLVKKLEKKNEPPDEEKVRDMFRAGLQSVKAVTEEVSVTANIQLKSSSNVSSSFTFDKNDKANEKPSVDVLPRIRGLTNLGNTCFFNAMMQCLSQTPFLRETLTETNENVEEFELPGGKLEIKKGEEIDLKPIRGTLQPGDGNFTEVLARTLEELQTKSGGVFTPKDLLRQFTQKWPQFAGGDQHDSHEALRHLLESVRSEDLRRYQLVILQEMGYKRNVDPSSVDVEKKQIIKFYGNQVSERILCPEPVFRGFLVSTLTCQDCGNISPRQETFLDISLPVNSDKPHPPSSIRRKTSPDPAIEICGPSKSQLKKEKREARRAKRVAKIHNRKNNQSSDSLKKDDSDNRNSSSVSDADVEDSIDDSASSKALLLDPNGNKVELHSPQSAEKKDDMPENLFKEPNNVVCEATMSSTGIANLTNLTKKLSIDENIVDEDEKTKAIKSQQLLRQNQARTRQISYVDWSNTLGTRYQCAENELSIQSCLNHFMSVEYMMGNNKVTCDACTERINGKNGKSVQTNATKQFLISSPPAVLILHLKRFQVGMRGMFR
jgi:ubiquitin carboxyl-terminal hydrolase 16/45